MVRYCFLLLLFTFGMLLVVPVSAFYDTFQNHPNDNITSPDDEWLTTWKYHYDPVCEDECGKPIEIRVNSINKKELFITGGLASCKCIPPGDRKEVYVRLTSPKACSNHWSLTIRSGCSDSNAVYLYFSFYNSSGGLINRSNNLKTYLIQYPDTHVWEFIRTGNTIYLYINGTFVGDIGGSYPEEPCYIEICEKRDYTGPEIYTYIDDISTGGQEVIEAPPHIWYILRHWDAPETSGVYNEKGSRVDEHYFTVSYLTPYIGVNAPDEIRIKHFTTGEVINVTTLSERYGTIYYNITKTLFHQSKEDDKYGIYLVELMRGGSIIAHDYFFFTWDATDKPAGAITWNRDSYPIGTIAKIHVNLTDPDFTTYVYKGYVYDVYGNKKEEWTVTSADEWHEVDLNGYDVGTYFAILRVRNKNTGFEYDEAWDTASIGEEVRIEGVSYNAKNETILGNVYVNAIQNYVDHEITTNATTGEYNISELCTDMEIQMKASKANYIHNNFSFTPLQNGLYNINLFLLPDMNHININPPAIVGLVQSYPFYQNVSEATINLWNISIGLTTSNTTNSMGYFEFTLDNTSMQTSDIENETFNSSEYDTWINLANDGIVPYTEKVTNTTDENPYYRGTDYEMDYVSGKIKVLSTGNMSNNTDYHIDYEKYETTYYSINATKFRYEQIDQPLNFTVNGTEIKYVYLLMNPIYNLTVRARSADTHATIMEFNTILNDGNVVQTTTGYINFSVNYGIHKVEVSADGYYSQVSYVYVAEDTEKVIYLTPLEEGGGAGTYYPPPHLVEFKVQNVWGQPLSGINVTAVPSETSMVNWSWIQSVYGYGENISQTMSGVTDSNGAVSFVMVETIKYKMYFTNESQNISAYREIYPKDDRYVITIGEIPEEKIGWWLSTAQNDTANTGNITIHYLDYNEPVKTQWVNFSIYFLDNDTLVYSCNFTTVNATNENTSIDLNASYTYKVKITAYHEDYGVISSTTIIVFVIPEKPKLPVAQELFKHLEPWQITMISMFVLICFGFIFGAISAGTGGLIVAAMAAGFYYFGLLPSLSKEVASIVIPLILIVAVANKLIEQRGVIRE